MFPCEICEIFKNTFFYRTPLVAASELMTRFQHCNLVVNNQDEETNKSIRERYTSLWKCRYQQYLECVRSKLVAKVWFQKSRWVMVPLIHLREGPGVRKQLCAKFLGTLNLDDCPADESSNEFSLYRWNEVKSYFRNRNFWKSNNSLNLCILQAKLLWMSQKSFFNKHKLLRMTIFPFL